MSRSRASLAVVAAVTSASCLVLTDSDATLTIHNHSSKVLTEVHLAEVDDPTWGPDLLPDVLYPGEDLVIEPITCHNYDVMVVAENGVSCVRDNMHLCFDDRHWGIDDATLAYCATR